MKILINHVGYELNGAKKVVVRGNSAELPAYFTLLHESGESFYVAPLEIVGTVDNWQQGEFAVGDFSAVQEAGIYRIAVGIVTSERFKIGENLLAEMDMPDVWHYFKSQGCTGKFDQADHEIPFVGERKDRVDVHGGWYDASGDTSKYLSHLSYANFMNPQQTPLVVWAMLQSAESLATATTTRLLSMVERLREEALYGADFLLRMQDSDGYFYMTVFDRWSKDVTQREICAYETMQGHKFANYQAGYRQGGGITIAALARASQVASNHSADYLTAAERGFDHLEKHNLDYLDDGRENIIDDYCALLAATELYATTNDERYLTAARLRQQQLADRLSADGAYQDWWRADANGERPYFHAAEAGLPVVALLRYAEVEPDHTRQKATHEIISRSLTFEIKITNECANPFGYARQYVKPIDAPKQSSFFFPHQNESGYWWQGENARLASLAVAGKWASRVVEGKDSAEWERYATDQLNWIFGLNPFDSCMLQGRGRNTPDYHPAYPNAPGGVCNGITSGVEDEHDIAFSPAPYGDDMLFSWRWSEQWIPHGAWLLLALSYQ